MRRTSAALLTSVALTLAVFGCSSKSAEPLNRRDVLDEADRICREANERIGAAPADSTTQQIFLNYAESARSIARLAERNEQDDIYALMSRVEQATSFRNDEPTPEEVLAVQTVATEVRAAGFAVCGW